MNALAGGKVAIVSDKPQTTRRRISAAVDGELDGEPYQLVLVDLPGFQRPRDALTGRMQRTVNEALEDLDGILFVLAADETIGDGDRFIAERVFGRAPVVLVLNKVDRVSPARIAEQIERAAALGDFHALHPVSAVTGTASTRFRPSSPRCCRKDPLLRGGRPDRPPARGAGRRDRPRESASGDEG